MLSYDRGTPVWYIRALTGMVFDPTWVWRGYVRNAYLSFSLSSPLSLALSLSLSLSGIIFLSLVRQSGWGWVRVLSWAGQGCWGCVFKAHRLLHHLTLGLRVIKKKTNNKQVRVLSGVGQGPTVLILKTSNLES